MKADLYNSMGAVIGTIDASDRVFGVKWNGDLMRQVLNTYEANERRPLAHTKGRGEVSGGGKKPWKQKGTGRARVGSNRSPIWRKGGITHGPIKDKDYHKALPKKMARKATVMALSQKLRDNELKFISGMDYVEAKTKVTATLLKPFADLKKKNQLLVVVHEKKEALNRSLNNIKAADWVLASDLNAKKLIGHRNIIVLQDALALMEKNYNTL
ncbi:MAG: 50S ribosomal protein L4 [Parcubacteria group bacterium]|nr:50S ribosomal protein L4 [Parcubacteria group bacterium]